MDVLEEGFQQLYLTCYACLDPLRRTAPRLYFVSDRALLEALALAYDPARLPAGFLGAMFHGLGSLGVEHGRPGGEGGSTRGGQLGAAGASSDASRGRGGGGGSSSYREGGAAEGEAMGGRGVAD